jgi:hypothetical protein
MSQVSSAKVLIGPAYAQPLLDDTARIIRNDPKTKEHRNIYQTVHLYTRDMLNGDWAPNGEVISLDGSGAVLNAKHRLSGTYSVATTLGSMPTWVTIFLCLFKR